MSDIATRAGDALLVFVAEHPFRTSRELAALMGWTPKRMAVRLNAIRGRGLVVEGERRRCRVTGVLVKTWRVKHDAVDVDRRFVARVRLCNDSRDVIGHCLECVPEGA